MNKITVLLGILLLVFFNLAYAANENLALLSKGGRVEFPGTVYGETYGVEKAFDGAVVATNQMTYNINQAENKNVGIDRIWDKKAKISTVQFLTKGAGLAYEYTFLYWDLEEEKWVELVYVTGNADDNEPLHYIKPAVITDKIRFICHKAGKTGEANFLNVYELEYYGEFVD